jgi:Asp-tRNA(Asn)/Glu-tRNA(Gln) amidotransferase A subunit family amidase
MRPDELSAVDAVALIRAGRLSATRLVEACLERIAQREPRVRAWAAIDAEGALSRARAIDAKGGRDGLLHGIPVGVKDVIETADLATAYGSPIYEGHRPRADAACVALLRAEGGIVLGKTVTAEFATTTPGATRNPWNPAFTPGGSSSGSAAAVADCMVPLACGTQTAGSVLRPAAFCGIAGFKPTFGWLSRQGVKQVSESLDTLGSFGRTVGDAALMAAAMARRPGLALADPDAPASITVVRTDAAAEAAPEAWTALERVARLLSAAGVAVGAAELPEPCSQLPRIHPAIEHYETARALAHEHAYHADRLSPKLRDRLDHGIAMPHEEHAQAQAVARACREAVARWFDGHRLLLTPSAPGEAPQGHATTGSASFNRRWSLLGLPCLTLPVMHGPNGLPVGVQLVARWHDEAALLAAAAFIERQVGWRA